MFFFSKITIIRFRQRRKYPFTFDLEKSNDLIGITQNSIILTVPNIGNILVFTIYLNDSDIRQHQLNTYIAISHRNKLFHHLALHLRPSFSLSLFQVITIFSASNYYEIGSNKGAYLKLNPQLDTHFVQYTAAASKTRKLTFRQRVGLVESSALRELGARLRERRNELEREFRARDPDATGGNIIFFFSFPICRHSSSFPNRKFCLTRR